MTDAQERQAVATLFWSDKKRIPDLLVKFGPLVLFLLTYLSMLNIRPMFIPDEVRYAEIAREILATGDWIVPRLNGVLYFEKPPMGHWLNAIALSLFGENPFAIRITSALAAGIVSLAVYFLVKQARHGTSTALAASFIYLTMLEVFGVGTFSVLDSMFTLFLNLGLVLFYTATIATGNRQKNLWLALSGLIFGCAFLTKGFLALVLPGLVLGVWLLWTRQFRLILSALLIVGLFMLMTVAPWAWQIHKAQPDFWRYFIWVEHIQRFMAENAQHKQPIYYFIVLLPLLAFPWVSLLPAAIHGMVRSNAEQNSSHFTKFLMLWLLLPLMFFSVSSGKLLTYVLPCFAPLAILIAIGIERYQAQGGTRLMAAGLYLNASILLVAVMALVLVQFLLDGQKLYMHAEIGKFWLLTIFLASCTLLLILMATRKINRDSLFINGLISVLLLTCVSFTLPESVYKANAPGLLLTELRRNISNDTVIVSHGSLVRAASWYLKRSDIIVHAHKGELTYGLDAEGGERFKDRTAIGPFINTTMQGREVLVLCKLECDAEVIEVLPLNVKRRVFGEFFTYRIPAQNIARE